MGFDSHHPYAKFIFNLHVIYLNSPENGPMSLFENVRLVKDNNFQTDYFKTEYHKMSDTITKLLVESMNQVHIAHSCYCCDHIACVQPLLPSKKLFEGKGSCTRATITILAKSSGSPVFSACTVTQ